MSLKISLKNNFIKLIEAVTFLYLSWTVIFDILDRYDAPLYFYNHIQLLSIIFFLYFFTIWLLKKLIKHYTLQELSIKEYILIFLTIGLFSYIHLPIILHQLTAKQIEFEAKVLKINQYTYNRSFKYKGAIVHTKLKQIDNKELLDIPPKAFFYLEENELIDITGKYSKYLFTVEDIRFSGKKHTTFHAQIK
jgi:hypothetical protein